MRSKVFAQFASLPVVIIPSDKWSIPPNLTSSTGNGVGCFLGTGGVVSDRRPRFLSYQLSTYLLELMLEITKFHEFSILPMLAINKLREQGRIVFYANQRVCKCIFRAWETTTDWGGTGFQGHFWILKMAPKKRFPEMLATGGDKNFLVILYRNWTFLTKFF